MELTQYENLRHQTRADLRKLVSDEMDLISTGSEYFENSDQTLDKNKPFILDDRKTAVLHHTQLKGFLGNSHIKELVYSDRGKSCVYKALQKLCKFSFLNRRDFTLGHGKGSLESFYHLTRKGFNLLQNSGLVDLKQEFIPLKNHLSFGAYQHRKAILDYWVSLEVQCEKYPKFRLVSFYPDWQSIIGGNQVKVTGFDEYYEDNLTIRPDSTFVLQNMATSEKFLFFLEIDLGTIPICSYGKKDITGRLEKYQLLFSKLAFQKIRPEFKEFTEARVLFFTSNMRRLEHALNEIYINSQIKSLFLFALVSEIKEKGSLKCPFMMSHDDRLYNLFSKDYWGN